VTGQVRVDTDALGALAAELTATADELGRMAVAVQSVPAHPVLVWAALEHPVRIARSVALLEQSLWGPGGLTWVAAGYLELAAEVGAQLAAIEVAEAGMAVLAAGETAVGFGLTVTDMAAGLALDLGLRSADPAVLAGRAALDDWIPEGPGLVADAPLPVAGPLPARPTIGDLYTRLETLAPGEVELAAVTGADGVVRYVVLLRGMEPTLNPTVNTLGQAVKSSNRHVDAYSRAVSHAIARAGVPAGADLMLVGHSQGGIAAMNLAASLRGYRVSHVVTAGSPVANKALGAGTTVLRIENRGDPVPQLDGAREPARAGEAVYRFGRDMRLSRVVPNHLLGSGYLAELTAAAGPFAGDPAVRAFAASAAPFLEGTPGPPHRYRLDAGPLSPPDAARWLRPFGRG
jgi:hypothetical protein